MLAKESRVQKASKESLPPLMTPDTLIYVPLERIPEERMTTSRLPASAETVASLEQPTTTSAVRPMNMTFGQMRRLPPVESEPEVAPASPQPPSAAKPSGPKRLSPARPVHVAEQPVGAGLR